MAELRLRDERLAELARIQRGVVSLDQLHELQFSESTIRRRAGRSLFLVAPTVFAVGHTGLSRRGRGNAALLQAGGDAALSHETAARMWDLLDNPGEGPIHVSVRNRSDIATPPGIVLHRPRNLRDDQVVDHRHCLITTPERTIIDLLPAYSVAETTRLLERMVTALNRSPDDLHTWAEDLRGVSGRRTLMRAMDEVAGPAVIRSQFESLFRSVCQEGGLPQAKTNHRLGYWEIDAAWLDLMVAVELDSYKFHGGRWSFHRDRRKGAALSSAGFELLRFSWPQLKHDRSMVIQALTQALERGRLRKLGAAADLAGNESRPKIEWAA